MKVAIISFGHADSAIPMAKSLAGKADVELFFIFTPGGRTNNFAIFPEEHSEFGLQDEKITRSIFPQEVWEYTEDKFKVHSWVLKNLKLKSLYNLLQWWKFSKVLKHFDIIHINGKNLFVALLKIFLPFSRSSFSAKLNLIFFVLLFPWLRTKYHIKSNLKKEKKS